MAQQENVFLEWSRGTGKSTVLAKKMVDFAVDMPRSSIALVGATYSQILTRTLPSTIQGLELLGYKKDVHYFVGRKAPASWKWPEAYQPPLNYEHAIHWYTGTTFHMISLDMANGGRGLNVDGVIGDEAALFDYDRLFANVLATVRGNLDRFRGNPLHQNSLFASSVPMTVKGKWLLKMEAEAKTDPKKILYLRADSMHNYRNLGPKWFRDNKRIMTPMIYNAEIRNIRPGKLENGFYPQFKDDRHCRDDFNNGYLMGLDWDTKKAMEAGCRADGDLVTGQPLDIACDYGASFNGVVTGQEAYREYRYLSAMHRLSPHLIDEVIEDWCKYYQWHNCRIVNYYYDQTAKGGGHSETFKDMVVRVLVKNGWTVNEIDIGAVPSHHDRYLFWGIAHQEKDSRLPVFRYNTTNCKWMVLSINNAGVLQGRNGFEKDKRPERNKREDQSETTHYSDAHDTLGYAKFGGLTSSSAGDFILPY